MFFKILMFLSQIRFSFEAEIGHSDEHMHVVEKQEHLISSNPEYDTIKDTQENPINLTKMTIKYTKTQKHSYAAIKIFEHYLSLYSTTHLISVFLKYNPSVLSDYNRVQDEKTLVFNIQLGLMKLFKKYSKCFLLANNEFNLITSIGISHIAYKKENFNPNITIYDSFFLFYEYINLQFNLEDYICANNFSYGSNFSIDNFLMFSFMPFENFIKYINTKCQILIDDFCLYYYRNNKFRSKKEVEDDILIKTETILRLFAERKFVISDLIISYAKTYGKIILTEKRVDFYCTLNILYLKCVLNPEISSIEAGVNADEKANNIFMAEANFLLLFYDIKNLKKNENYYFELFNLMKIFVVELFNKICNGNPEFIQYSSGLFEHINEKICLKYIFYLIDLQLKSQNIYLSKLEHSSFSELTKIWREKTYFN